LPSYPLWQTVIVVPVFSEHEDVETVIAHEVSHAISFAVLHQQPRWLAEGMAMYFETMQFNADNTAVDVGVGPRSGSRPRRMGEPVPVSTLLSWKTHDYEHSEHRLYSTAWALFTFLLNAHRAELLRYIELLQESDLAAQRVVVPTMRTWDQAFASLPLATVDQELRSWLVSGQHIVLHFRLESRASPIVQRTLSDAEVHAIQGYLIANRRQKREHIAAALRLEPTNVLAQALRLGPNKTLSAAEGRAIAAAHSDDWRAWWMAAMALRHDGGNAAEASAAAARACALIARNPAVRAPPELCGPSSPQAASP
jgi:hypothetical protein